MLCNFLVRTLQFLRNIKNLTSKVAYLSGSILLTSLKPAQHILLHNIHRRTYIWWLWCQLRISEIDPRIIFSTFVHSNASDFPPMISLSGNYSIKRIKYPKKAQHDPISRRSNFENMWFILVTRGKKCIPKGLRFNFSISTVNFLPLEIYARKVKSKELARPSWKLDIYGNTGCRVFKRGIQNWKDFASPLTQFSKFNNFLWVCWFL